MKRTIFIFGALVAALLCLFQLSKYSYASGDITIETSIALAALLFFFIGMYINKKSLSRKQQPPGRIDAEKIEELGLSRREYEVLLQVSKGLSNKEIGDSLFLSESTIKTHVSSILVKLDAKRRTQAVQIAKELQVIPY